MRRDDPEYKALRAQLNEKAAIVSAVLNTPGGQALLEALEDRYLHGNLVGANELATYMNLGARDVVLRLRSMQLNREGTGASNG